MKSILDRSFKYTPSSDTDLRKTFAKARREQRLNTKPTAQQKPIRANFPADVTAAWEAVTSGNYTAQLFKIACAKS